MVTDSAYHFPQYFWYWLEVFSAPRKEAGVSSNKIDEKHQLVLFNNTRMPCCAGTRVSDSLEYLAFPVPCSRHSCYGCSTWIYHSTEQKVYLGPFHPAYRTYCYSAFPIFQESYKNFLMLLVSMNNLNLNILELSYYKLHPLLQDRL